MALKGVLVNVVRVLMVCLLGCLTNACTPLFNDFKAPGVSLVNIEPVKLGFFEQRFELLLRVQNPNAVELPIRGLQYFLQLNDKDFAEGFSGQEITIPKYGEEMIAVPITANLGSLLKQFRNINRESIGYRL